MKMMITLTIQEVIITYKTMKENNFYQLKLVVKQITH